LATTTGLDSETSAEPMDKSDYFDAIGIVARWRPVHLGHVPVLRAICDRAGKALIGIGSSNRYNYRNPFTLEETEDMLRLVLDDRDNYSLVPVPDLDDGPRWRLMVKDMFGELGLFVTANPYVTNLISADYKLIHPIDLISEAEKVAIDGSLVRSVMARGGEWEALVPGIIASYIKDNGLDERFRQEFGLQTIAMETVIK
jgi:nicotinamide-nucleotide adenylyltransferase